MPCTLPCTLSWILPCTGDKGTLILTMYGMHLGHLGPNRKVPQTIIYQPILSILYDAGLFSPAEETGLLETLILDWDEMNIGGYKSQTCLSYFQSHSGSPPGNILIFQFNLPKSPQTWCLGDLSGTIWVWITMQKSFLSHSFHWVLMVSLHDKIW